MPAAPPGSTPSTVSASHSSSRQFSSPVQLASLYDTGSLPGLPVQRPAMSAGSVWNALTLPHASAPSARSCAGA